MRLVILPFVGLLCAFSCSKPTVPAPVAPVAPVAPTTPTPAAPPDAPPKPAVAAEPAPAPVLVNEQAPAAARIDAAGVKFESPSTWTQEPPSSAMRLHQFKLPGAGADANAILTVSSAGGSVEANLERWRRQFEGTPAEVRDGRTANGLTVTVVSLTGTYVDKPSPMSPEPGIPRSGWSVRGAIVEGPAGLVFFKAWGPAETLDHHQAAFDALVAGLTK